MRLRACTQNLNYEKKIYFVEVQHVSVVDKKINIKNTYMNTEEKNINQNPTDEEQPIDWMEMVAKLLKHKWFIIIFTAIFTVVGVAYALVMKRKYDVQVIVTPEIEGKSATSSLKGIASMLGLGGMSAGNGMDAITFMVFPEVCSSTPFLTDLFSVPVTTYVSEKAYEKGKRPKTTTLFKYISKEDEPEKGISAWLEDVFGDKDKKKVDNSVVNPSKLTKMQDKVCTYLSKHIGANVDQKTGLTTISVSLDDPLIAATVADTVCQRLQNYVSEYKTKKAKQDLDYYTKLCDEAHESLINAQQAYARSVDFDRSVILQTVSSEKERLRVEAQLAQQVFEQMEQQKAAAKAKYQELRPAFAVIQPATMPLKANNSRSVVVLGFMIFGFIISAGWKLFIADYIKKFKNGVKERKLELTQGDVDFTK